MEELKNKTFLVKVRKDLFDYLKSGNNFDKVGKLRVFLNKKRNQPEFIFHFNKENGPKDYTLTYNKTNDYIYFGDKETKDGLRIGNVDNFGNLIVNEDGISDEMIKNAFNEKNKNQREIQVKEVKDGEKRYIHNEEIKLFGSQYAGKKKKKKMKIDDELLKGYIKEEVKKNSYITPMIISDKYNVPEKQVKEMMDKICERELGKNRKYCYTLKIEYED